MDAWRSPLLEGFVRRGARPGGCALDPLAGACCTLIACQALGRYRDAHLEPTIGRAG